MDTYYQLALQGRLASENTGVFIPSYTITNGLQFPVMVYWLNSSCEAILWYQPQPMNPGAAITQSSPPVQAGTWWLVTCALTGSFIGVFQANADDPPNFTITSDLLCDPNDIGTYPQPMPGGPIIPPDSPRVLVGYGFAPNGTPFVSLILREQYWERMSDSYCLAPLEQRVFSTTTTEGTQSTSSSQSDVSGSLGLSASAGWGSISASVSASLSVQATTFQQLTVSAETTAYISDTVTNTTEETRMYLRWQLTDVVTTFTNVDPPNFGYVPTGSIIAGENPVLTGKPYVLKKNS